MVCSYERKENGGRECSLCPCSLLKLCGEEGSVGSFRRLALLRVFHSGQVLIFLSFGRTKEEDWKLVDRVSIACL